MLCERRPALGVVAFGGAMTQRPRFVERLVDALVVRADSRSFQTRRAIRRPVAQGKRFFSDGADVRVRG